MASLQKNVFRYESLVEEIEIKISKGIFKPGEKLPSVREMHRKQIDMSITTVSEAYIMLESKGKIEARERSGYYVKTVSPFNIKIPEKSHLTLVPPKINRPSIVEEIMDTISDKTKVPLGAIFLSPVILSFNQYSKILKNLTKKEIKSVISYNLTQGLPEL